MALNLFLNWVKFTPVDLNRAARPDQRQPRRQQRLTFSIKRRGWRKVKSCWSHLNDPWYVFLELRSPSQVSEVQTVLRRDQICYPEVLLALSLDVFGVAPSVLTAIVVWDSSFETRWCPSVQPFHKRLCFDEAMAVFVQPCAEHIEYAPTSAHTLQRMETDSNSCQAPQTFAVSLVTFFGAFLFCFSSDSVSVKWSLVSSAPVGLKEEICWVKSWCTAAACMFAE